MIYRITHSNTYSYSEPVTLCHNVVHLAARDTPRQRCRNHQLVIQPVPGVASARTDYFGNPVASFAVQEPHQKLELTAINLVEIQTQETAVPKTTPPWEQVRDLLACPDSPDARDACQFLFDSLYVKRHVEPRDYAQPSFSPVRPLLEAILDLTGRMHADFRYDKTATTTSTPVLEALHHRHGVCQAFAHLAIGCLRSLGLAARYVSGYLVTMPPPGKPRLVGADASHAWLAVFCPGSGWIDIDPTNNMIPAGQHIVLAWGRDYDDVSPIKGVILGGGTQEVTVAVDVAPVEE